MAPKAALFDQNLIVDPGFGFTKVAYRDGTKQFKNDCIPSVIALYDSRVTGILDRNTVKVTINESSRVGINSGDCRLVGNQAKVFQGESDKLFAFMFPKSDKDIILWTILAAFSRQIPKGLKEVKIADAWVVCSLQNLGEKDDLILAIAGKHHVTFEREIDGYRDVVSAEINWTKEKIHVVQEGSGGIHYVLENNLYDLDLEDEDVQYGSVSIGAGTLDLVRQNVVGDILQVSSHKLGLSTLAGSISRNPELRQKANGQVTVDKVLQAIQEGGPNATFVYGKGTMGIDFKDIYLNSLKMWQKNIVSQILRDWDEEMSWIDQIFYFGGGVNIPELKEHKTSQSFFFSGVHDPQFVDVWGFRIWAEKNLF